MTISFDSINLFLIVFVRLAGMILLNPMLARRNVPTMVRMGLVFFLTILVAPTIAPTQAVNVGDFELAFLMLKELAIGLLFGIVFQMFYLMLFFTGDLLDVTFGLSMAKVFDPGTNLQVSITSNLFLQAFMMYVFVTDTHLAIIQLFCYTFKAIPLGGAVLTAELAKQMMALFIGVFMLVIRLALPFVAMEFVLEMGMGILMRFVSQIQVFTINFQLKQGLGFLMLLMFAPFIGSFLDNYIISMMENMQNALVWLGGTL